MRAKLRGCSRAPVGALSQLVTICGADLYSERYALCFAVTQRRASRRVAALLTYCSPRTLRTRGASDSPTSNSSCQSGSAPPPPPPAGRRRRARRGWRRRYRNGKRRGRAGDCAQRIRNDNRISRRRCHLQLLEPASYTKGRSHRQSECHCGAIDMRSAQRRLHRSRTLPSGPRTPTHSAVVQR